MPFLSFTTFDPIAEVGHRLRGQAIHSFLMVALLLIGRHFMLRTRARRRSLLPRLLPSSARISIVNYASSSNK